MALSIIGPRRTRTWPRPSPSRSGSSTPSSSCWDSKAAREAFADRAYLPDGRLLPRSEPGAVLEDVDLIAERALRMVLDRHVVAVDGTRVIVRADSLCVHGDGPRAAAIVRRLRQRFEAEGITVAPFVR